MKRKTKNRKKLKRWIKHRKRKSKRILIEHHDRIWKLGEYYNSDFVKQHMPWVRGVPFHEFLDRQMGRVGERIA